MKNKLQKLKHYFKKLQRVSNLSKSDKYVWNDLIQLMDELELNYSRNDTTKTVHLNMNIFEDTAISYRYSLSGSYLIVGGLIVENIEVEKMNDMLVLASHVNAMLPVGVVLVNANRGYVEYYLELDVYRLLLFPSEIYEGMYLHNTYTKDHIFPTFQKMHTSWEDPIFIFSEFMENFQKKN